MNRWLAYDAWANREMLEALRACDPPPTAAVARLAHIVGAHETWLARLAGETGPVDVWPDAELDGVAQRLERLDGRWREWSARLDERIAYANTKGRKFESTVGEICSHVALHGAYHRGQIALELRAAGHAPPATDFIHATREGTL